jgi:hypothetical protein
MGLQLDLLLLHLDVLHLFHFHFVAVAAATLPADPLVHLRLHLLNEELVAMLLVENSSLLPTKVTAQHLCHPSMLAWVLVESAVALELAAVADQNAFAAVALVLKQRVLSFGSEAVSAAVVVVAAVAVAASAFAAAAVAAVDAVAASAVVVVVVEVLGQEAVEQTPVAAIQQMRRKKKKKEEMIHGIGSDSFAGIVEEDKIRIQKSLFYCTDFRREKEEQEALSLLELDHTSLIELLGRYRNYNLAPE